MGSSTTPDRPDVRVSSHQRHSSRNRAEQRRISGSRQSASHAIHPQAAGQQASRAPGRLNWPQDRHRPDPWSASGAGLARARARPLPWPHEFPDPGTSHQFSSSSADSGKSHRCGGSSPPGRENPQPGLMICDVPPVGAVPALACPMLLWMTAGGRETSRVRVVSPLELHPRRGR